MWDDIRTYVTSEIASQEKSSHFIILHRFKHKVETK